jgi:hypothetical protein
VVLLLPKLDTPELCAWYADRAAAEAWSRTKLQRHVERRAAVMSTTLGEVAPRARWAWVASGERVHYAEPVLTRPSC